MTLIFKQNRKKNHTPAKKIKKFKILNRYFQNRILSLIKYKNIKKEFKIC